MDQDDLVSGKKNAARLKAHIVFIDETGLLMAPLVRRTWSQRGVTPVLHQQGRSREKATMVGALSVSPKRRRIGLYYALGPSRNFDTAWAEAFVRALARHLRGPIIIIWDQLGAHKAVAKLPSILVMSRIRFVLLPPYAPELNPVEFWWSYLKTNPLANFAPHDIHQLCCHARRHTARIRKRPDLLRSFFRCTPLSLRL